MAELNIVDTGAGGAVGRILTPYLQTLLRGYTFGDGNGYLEFGSGTPGSLPFRVDQAGNITAKSINASIGGGLAPSTDVSGPTDFANIQGLLNLGLGPVKLGAGQFYINAALTLITGSTLTGAGEQQTFINQVSTTAHGIYANNSYQLSIRDLSVIGPGSGTGDGIHFDQTTQVPANCYLANVQSAGFGEFGIFMNTPITTTLITVETRNNGSHGFNLENGTSTTLIGCYSNGDVGRGYNLNTMSYSALVGCAADSNGSYGYVFSSCLNVTATGCGAESQVANGAYDIIGGSNVTLLGCYTLHQPGVGCLVNSSATDITISGFQERSPAGGATSSITVNSGCSVLVLTPTVVTAMSLAAGTTMVIGSGTNTAAAAPVLTPTFVSGTAAQLADVTRDYMVYLECTTAGTALIVAIGPTSTPSHTIIASSTATLGELVSIRLPAGWFLKWSATSAAFATQTAIGC
jgi:hypothetical protein